MNQIEIEIGKKKIVSKNEWREKHRSVLTDGRHGKRIVRCPSHGQNYHRRLAAQNDHSVHRSQSEPLKFQLLR